MPDKTRPEATELADLLWEDIEALPEKEKLKIDAIIRLYCNETQTQIRKIMQQEVGKKIDSLNKKMDSQTKKIEKIQNKVGGINGGP